MQITAVAECRINVRWLAPTALIPQSGQSFVTIQDNQAHPPVAIKVGLTIDDKVEILSGLQEGQGVCPPD